MTVIFYIVISMPFILGLLIPSIHEGNAYSIIYIIVNTVPLIILNRVIDWISLFLFKSPTLYQTTIVTIGTVLVFWGLVAWLIGFMLDRRKRAK